jgi:hypothetical protein
MRSPPDLAAVVEGKKKKFFRRAFCYRDRLPGTLGKNLTASEATGSRSSRLAAVGTARAMARIT